jgi:phage gp45-like
MHRTTPLASAFRAYSAGGARSVVHSVDDSTLMQNMKGSFLAGETRDNIEAPQNYGFTSVTKDGEQAQGGAGGGGGSGPVGAIGQKSGMGPETFTSFIGGNRSFPVAGNIDDRRHRLFNLKQDAAEGASAMYGLREWGQQFLISNDGMYMTGNAGQQQSGSGGSSKAGSGSGSQQGYRIKLQLVDNQNAQQQQSGGSGGSGALVGWLGAVRKFFKSKSGVEFEYDIVVPRDASTGAGGGSGGQMQQGKGQKTLHKEQSTTYSDMTNQYIHHARGNGNVMVQDSKITTHYQDDSKSTWVDQNHVHISFSGNSIFTDSSGCWTTKPIQIKADNHSSSAAERDAEPILGAMVVAPTLAEGESMFAEFRELQERVRLLTQRIADLESGRA